MFFLSPALACFEDRKGTSDPGYFPAGSVGCFRDGGGHSHLLKKHFDELHMYQHRYSIPNDFTCMQHSNIYSCFMDII